MGNFHYSDAVREFARARKCNGYKKLDRNTYLYNRGDHFAVRLYSTDIVHLYPDYQQLYCGGWHSQLTFKCMNEWSCVFGRVSSYSKCGFDTTTRIQNLPFFDGIRIDNSGHVFPEDRRSDWKRVVKPEVVKAWKALHMPITKALRGRFDLGEFNEVEYNLGNLHSNTKSVLAQLTGLDREFPSHEAVMSLLSWAPFKIAGRGFNNWHHLNLQERWRYVLNSLRDTYYREHNGYIRVEVSNVQR